MLKIMYYFYVYVCVCVCLYDNNLCYKKKVLLMCKFSKYAKIKGEIIEMLSHLNYLS